MSQVFCTGVSANSNDGYMGFSPFQMQADSGLEFHPDGLDLSNFSLCDYVQTQTGGTVPDDAYVITQMDWLEANPTNPYGVMFQSWKTFAGTVQAPSESPYLFHWMNDDLAATFQGFQLTMVLIASTLVVLISIPVTLKFLTKIIKKAFPNAR